MSTISTKQLFMHHCLDCNNQFNTPNYWTVENALGYFQKVPYCPNCVSQNIERKKID